MSPSRPLVVLLTACAALAPSACGGSDADDRKLIAQSRSDALLRSVDRVEADLADDDCPGATAEIDGLRSLVEKLPKSTDGGLVANLTKWVDHLEGRVPDDCEAATEEPSATPTPVKTPETSVTPTPTPTPDETPTPSPTPDETETPEPTPDSGSGGSDEPGTGGATPEDEG